MASRIVPIMDKVQSAIGYRFKNVQFLREALQVLGTTIPSSEMNDVGTFKDIYGISKFRNSNKRLAVVGDAVLKTALLEDWYHTGHSRGLIGSLLSEVASSNNLNIVGRAHQLDTLMLSTRREIVELQSQYMADTVEAILGAAYLDEGMTSVQKIMSNLSLKSKLLHQGKLTEDGHSSRKQIRSPKSQHSPAKRIFQSTQELQRVVNDVLHWSQVQTALVDPHETLQKAIASASQCLNLLLSCLDILLKSPTLGLHLTIIDTVRSVHEVRFLMSIWKRHLKLRLWSQGRDLQRALSCIKSSCADLASVLSNSVIIDTGSTMMAEHQVIQNCENSFMRLYNFAHLVFPISELTPKALLTTLQRRIEGAVRSGRQVQGEAKSLRALHSVYSIPRRRGQNPAGFLPKPTKQQAIRNSEISFQRMVQLVETLGLNMDITTGTRLVSLRIPLKDMVESGRKVQGLANFLRAPTTKHAMPKGGKSVQEVVDPAKKLHSGPDVTSEMQLTPAREPLENVVNRGRKVQAIANPLHEPTI